MEHTVSSGHCSSPPSSSDRFLGIFGFSTSRPLAAISANGGGGDELNEAELFYAAGDASEMENHRSSSSPLENRNLRWSFHQNSGILAALPVSDRSSVLRRKPSPTKTMAIPSIPKSNGDGYYSQSVPGGGGGGRKFQQSAPVKVPIVPLKARRNGGDLAAVDDGDGDDDEMLLPPHKMVARSSGVLPNATSFSVLEGVGRTLKGRDLRQVRNAIWRKTGFLD